MNISTIALSNDGVTLTAYMLDSSPEMHPAICFHLLEGR